mmetsp:Transcript_70511/g.200023  ORF Transcript_70511/g.200023 Transcript_70511/m.200023 type:complete len:265 (+) Transcript_70511:314-1108(+)
MLALTQGGAATGQRETAQARAVHRQGTQPQARERGATYKWHQDKPSTARSSCSSPSATDSPAVVLSASASEQCPGRTEAFTRSVRPAGPQGRVPSRHRVRGAPGFSRSSWATAFCRRQSSRTARSSARRLASTSSRRSASTSACRDLARPAATSASCTCCSKLTSCCRNRVTSLVARASESANSRRCNSRSARVAAPLRQHMPAAASSFRRPLRASSASSREARVCRTSATSSRLLSWARFSSASSWPGDGRSAPARPADAVIP